MTLRPIKAETFPSIGGARIGNCYGRGVGGFKSDNKYIAVKNKPFETKTPYTIGTKGSTKMMRHKPLVGEAYDKNTNLIEASCDTPSKPQLLELECMKISITVLYYEDTLIK